MITSIMAIRGAEVIVDDDDLPLLRQFSWHIIKSKSGSGYARTSIYLGQKRKIGVYMHVLITRAPVDMVADHINGNKLDNRKSNLRLIKPELNAGNCVCAGAHKSSRGGWQSTIDVLGKRTYLGRFPSKEDAARAYEAASLRLRGEFSRAYSRLRGDCT